MISSVSALDSAIASSASSPARLACAIRSETFFFAARLSSTLGSRARRLLSSSSSLSIFSAAPRRASAALTASGSLRIRLRSSVAPARFYFWELELL